MPEDEGVVIEKEAGPLTFVQRYETMDPSGSPEVIPETVLLLVGRVITASVPALATGD